MSTDSLAIPGEMDIAATSPRQILLRRARSHIGFLTGTSLVLLAVAVAVFAPWLTDWGPIQQDLSHRLVNPVWGDGGSWLHPLGTDSFGRDVLSRVIYGARISLTVGFFAATLSAIVGSILGMVGGYFGGRTDGVIVYLINVKLALPPILIALSLVAVFGRSLTVLIFVLAFLFWDRYAVVTRSVTQQIRVADYIAAAQAAGASSARIILTEVLPNVANHIIVIASLEMAVAILVEASLSFLGLGVQPPTPSWGLLIAEGRQYLFFKQYLITVPGVAIFLLVIAINMMGDGIRDIAAPEGRN